MTAIGELPPIHERLFGTGDQRDDLGTIKRFIQCVGGDDFDVVFALSRFHKHLALVTGGAEHAHRVGLADRCKRVQLRNRLGARADQCGMTYFGWREHFRRKAGDRGRPQHAQGPCLDDRQQRPL